ncbi:MAG: hypothetical protein JWN29_1958, partial [Acidimicrobiales bacterium]|nr:hypothetical protein [Acidimicrobiales bacterium]
MALTFNVPSNRDEWRRAALVSLAVLVLAGVVVALVRSGDGPPGSTSSSGSSEASGSSKAFESAPATTVAPSARSTARSSDSAATGGSGSAPPEASALTGPRIVHTADLRVRVQRGTFASAIDRATAVATGAGGFV